MPRAAMVKVPPCVRRVALALLLSASARESTAQVPLARSLSDSLIRVGEDRSLSIDFGTFPTVEPYLAADPSNAAHLVAGVAVITKPDVSERSCAALTSFDGGRTWTRHDFPANECLDPWVVLRPDGSAVLALISRSELLVFRSSDGGITWSDRPISFGGHHDHGTLTIDTTRGSFGGSVYVVSQQIVRDTGDLGRFAAFVARSTDAGATFGEPTRVIVNNLQMNPMNPVVLSDGTLMVPLSDYGRTTPRGDFAWLARGRDWVIASADAARTFSQPLFVTEACGRSFPELAVDASEGYRDRLSSVCNDSSFAHVYLHISSDRGESWSAPVAVNRGSGRSPYVRTAAIAVNRDGIVGISWYDARNDRDESKGKYRCQEIFFTASVDGGRTFLPEVKVSSAKNCPNTAANGQVAERWPAGGDYHGLAAAANGEFHLVWADSRDGIYKLRTATVALRPKANRGQKP